MNAPDKPATVVELLAALLRVESTFQAAQLEVAAHDWECATQRVQQLRTAIDTLSAAIARHLATP